MNFALRQSTATVKVSIFMVDANGVGVTGIAAPDTLEISINNGAFAAMTADTGDGFWAEVGHGFYTVTPDATDTATVGPWKIHVAEAGCLPFDAEGFVYSVTSYDALFGSVGFRRIYQY